MVAEVFTSITVRNNTDALKKTKTKPTNPHNQAPQLMTWFLEFKNALERISSKSFP